ncbi:MAG: hypothetical protein AAFU69_13495, partial [Pseudomonadota bacterium]
PTGICHTGWEFQRNEAQFLPTEQGMALTDELNHFIDCIKTGARPQTDGAQGAAVVQILSS